MAPPDDPEVLTPWLAAAERDWLATGRPDQLVRAATRAALRHTLAERLGGDPREVSFVRACRHCGDPAHGKPAVAGTTISFSVSHTPGLGLVAVAEGVELGVDVERADRRPATDLGRLRRRILDDRERAAVEALAPDVATQAFLHLWAAKEAVAKADGRGLVLGLGTIHAGPLLDGDVAAVAMGADRWHVQRLVLPAPHVGFLASAVAVHADVGPWRW